MAESVWTLSDGMMVEHTRLGGETNARNWLFYLM
jgi:hypothetical protein